MNIYVVDSDPLECAQVLDDKTLVKQVLVVAQILSTALHNLGYWKSNLYRPTRVDHPCVHWAEASRGNFNWLVLHGLALGKEYKDRFGASDHRSTSVILSCAEAFTLCRLDQVEMSPWVDLSGITGNISVLKKYRQYLIQKWSVNAPRWTKRTHPEWFKMKEIA